METYLAHHGILGMKWGVRRYQNPDGTLTEAGKRHAARSSKFSEGVASLSKHTGNAFESVSASKQRKAQNAVVEKAKRMSDDDLTNDAKRTKLENTYVKNHGSGEPARDPRSQGKVFSDAMGDAANKVGRKYEKIAESETARQAKTMSDAELRAAIQRMQLEDQYRNLSKRDRESGANYVYSHRKEVFNDIVTYTTPIVTTIVMPLILNKILKE